ncbi:MAG: ATP-binding protein [Alkalinema sp. RU_4_3]|nr:ATP-binding protein [Alkalinema sp. RU_4_3]
MSAVLLSSQLDEINALLLEHNPFSQPPFVTANNVWGKSFPDVESLNSHASDAVFKALEEIQQEKLTTASILITAQDGTGKSHIISRIRHRLQDLGGSIFILANKFSDLNKVKPGFQQLLAESLSQIGSEGVKQWQELATAMVNDLRKEKDPTVSLIEAKDLVKRFEDENSETKVQEWVQNLTKNFCKAKKVSDPNIVRAIFWTLSEDESADASNWLGGKELAQYKANELRLPTQNQSFETGLQILNLISDYNSLIICFDEMDIADFNDAGLRKAQVISNLVKELFENLNRGVVLSVMMPGVWKNEIQANMPPAVSTKMTTYSEPLDLQYLDPHTAVELVAFFLKDYYDAREVTPPDRLYPFQESQVQKIGHGKPTIREMLKWCRENCKPPTMPNNKEEEHPVEIAFLAEMADDISNDLEKNALIADTLLYNFAGLVGETVERVTITEVTHKFGKKGGKEAYLNFKILGRNGDSEVGIAVSVTQDNSGHMLAATLKKLLTPDKFGLTRGCLVRSPEKPVSKYIRASYLEPLATIGGEFVKLYAQEIKPLVALKMVHDKAASDYKVSEDQVRDFVERFGQKYHLGKFNPLLCEILSDPSYQVVQDLIDEPEADPAMNSLADKPFDDTSDEYVLDELAQ